MTRGGGLGLGLYLDIQATQSAAHSDRGIARYVSEHARALIKRDGLVRGLALNPLLAFPEGLDPELLFSRLLGWGTASSFEAAAREGPLAYHLMSPIELVPPAGSVVPPHAMGAEIPLVATLYDLIPLALPERYLVNRELEKRYLARLEVLRVADLILCISENTRMDAIRLLGLDPGRLVVIGAGVSDFFRRAPQPEEGALPEGIPGLRRPFILSTLGAEERKNTEALLEAFALLPAGIRAGMQLVVVCRLIPAFRERWSERARALGLGSGEVVFTDWIPDHALRSLYRCAELFVFPSLYEGFGLPAAEAICCGCPAIVSSTTSLPEIIGWPPATFDPRDPQSMAALMEKALSDQAFRSELERRCGEAAPKHRWGAVAERTADAVAGLLDRGAGTVGYVRARRPRVALVGPFPPAVSGIADYNAALARALEGRCDLDLISVTPAERNGDGALRRHRRFPIQAFGKTLNPHSYHAVIYSFGNNEHHFDTYELARRFPGILWMHDVLLAGFYLKYAESRMKAAGEGSFMLDALRRQYHERVPGTLMQDPMRAADQYLRRGVGMTRELAGSARAIIVNSEFSRRMLEMDQPPQAQLPPVWVLPLAVQTPPPAPAIGRDAPAVVASFGYVGLVKAPDAIIEAVAGLSPALGDPRLVFVGPVDADVRIQLEHQARLAGLDDRVLFTGAVPPEEYWGWIRRATLAVQVRRASNGEGSASVNDCLAAGLPVITNVLSCREMPPGTVELVGSDLSSEALGGAISRLLPAEDERARLSQKGLDYARDRTFEKLAGQLLEVVESTSGARSDRRSIEASGR